MYWNKTFNNKELEIQLQFETLLPQLEISFHLNEMIFNLALNILNIFAFEITRTRKIDHAGINIDIALFAFHFRLSLYDIRHWNWKNGQWVC